MAENPTCRQRPSPYPDPRTALANAQQILVKLYAARVALATQPYATVTIDGQTVQFTRGSDLDEQILFWERKTAVLSGRRRRAQAIRMDHF